MAKFGQFRQNLGLPDSCKSGRILEKMTGFRQNLWNLAQNHQTSAYWLEPLESG
jgi:hypothetical protein